MRLPRPGQRFVAPSGATPHPSQISWPLRGSTETGTHNARFATAHGWVLRQAKFIIVSLLLIVTVINIIITSSRSRSRGGSSSSSSR
eukprot:9113250-Pyramimonas_sp.AAC.1